MATYKRHIVYLSDEEWKQVTTQAKSSGLTISAYMRVALFGDPRDQQSIPQTPGGPPFPQHSFAQFRPVPKPTRR